MVREAQRERDELASPVVSRWLVAALMLATFVNFLGSLGLGVFLPQVAAELGVTVALVGQVPALVMMLAAFVALVIGPLADHYGVGRTLLVGVSAATLSTLAVGLAPSYALLLLVTVIGAIGRAAVQPSAQATVAARFADEKARRFAMSRVQMGNSGAAIVGIPLMTAIATLGSWRLGFLTLAGVSLLALVILWRTLPRDESSSSSRPRLGSVLANYALILRQRSTSCVLVATLLSSVGSWTIWAYLASFLIEVHGFTNQDAGWVYLAGGGGVMTGTMLSGTRLGANPRRLMITSRFSSAFLFAGAMLLPLPGLGVVITIGLAMVMQGLYSVPNLLVLNAETPVGRATTMTLNNSAMSLGTALGGMVGGLALSLGGYSALGLCAPIFPLLAASLIWWSRPRPAPPITVGA